MMFADWGKLLLRVGTAILLMLHGVAKLKNGIAWMAGPLGGLGLPLWVGYGAFVGEIIAPIFLILGKFSRLAGLVVTFNLFMAIVVARRGDILKITQGGGWAIELEVLFMVCGVSIFLLGSGKYSLSKGEGRWD